MKRHIALVGFMTSGKSSVGQRLARQLHCAFCDTDQLVERDRGPIADIFATKGEATFREFESQALRLALEPRTASVVSVGGGMLVAPANRSMLRKHAHSVFIRLSPRRAYDRLRRSRVSRPLLGPKPSWSSVEALYASRLGHYAEADYTVDADGVSTTSIVDAIAAWIHEQRIAI